MAPARVAAAGSACFCMAAVKLQCSGVLDGTPLPEATPFIHASKHAMRARTWARGRAAAPSNCCSLAASSNSTSQPSPLFQAAQPCTANGRMPPAGAKGGVGCACQPTCALSVPAGCKGPAGAGSSVSQRGRQAPTWHRVVGKSDRHVALLVAQDHSRGEPRWAALRLAPHTHDLHAAGQAGVDRVQRHAVGARAACMGRAGGGLGRKHTQGKAGSQLERKGGQLRRESTGGAAAAGSSLSSSSLWCSSWTSGRAARVLNTRPGSGSPGERGSCGLLMRWALSSIDRRAGSRPPGKM